MPRNSSGTYALPAGNPVVTNTLIQSTWANTTLSDVSTAMTDSLDRNGRGAMLAPLKNVDGTAVAPAMSFSSEGTLGIYRVAAGVLGFSAGGALVLSIAAAGLTFTNPIILPIGSAAAPSLTFVANTNTGIYSPTTNQVGVTTNGAQRLLIDATGNVSLATGALVFPAAAAGVIEASNAAGTLALQTGGANTRLSIDAAGVVTVAQTTVLTGAVGIGGANALGKLQVFGGAVVIDNAQFYAAKSSGGAATTIAGLDASNNLIHGAGAAVATQQFATGGTVRLTLDASGNVGFRVTPNAWSTLTAIEGSSGALVFNTTASVYVVHNLYYNGSNWIYRSTGTASMHIQNSGNHQFATVASGTAGGAATLTVGMLLDSNSTLTVGPNASNPNNRLVLLGGRANVEFVLKSTVASGGSGASTIYFGNSASDTVGYINYDHSTNSIALNANGAVRLSISSSGIIADGAVGVGNELGYKGLPQTNLVAGYTLVVGDRGKHIYQRAAASVTVPSGVFSTGDAVTIVNGTSGSISVVQGASVTMQQAGTTNTGNRTLLANGVCTVICVGTNTFHISGTIT